MFSLAAGLSLSAAFRHGVGPFLRVSRSLDVSRSHGCLLPGIGFGMLVNRKTWASILNFVVDLRGYADTAYICTGLVCEPFVMTAPHYSVDERGSLVRHAFAHLGYS